MLGRSWWSAARKRTRLRSGPPACRSKLKQQSKALSVVMNFWVLPERCMPEDGATAAAAGDREKITQRWTSTLTKKMDRQARGSGVRLPPEADMEKRGEEAEGGRRVTVATHSA